LKERYFAEEKELLSVISELMNEIQPDMILRVFADWLDGSRVVFS
jgi:hypothetical protein